MRRQGFRSCKYLPANEVLTARLDSEENVLHLQERIILRTEAFHGDLVPGSSLCHSSTQEGSEFYRHRGADAGPRHWRKHGHLQPGELAAAQAAPGAKTGTDRDPGSARKQRSLAAGFLLE